MKTKIFTLLLICCLFVSTSFAQENEVAYDPFVPSITIFSSIHGQSIYTQQPYQSGMCFSLEYNSKYEPAYFFCGTGLTDKELREQSRNTTQTPEFSIIDIQGNTVFVLEPEVTPCPQPYNNEPAVIGDYAPADGYVDSLTACGSLAVCGFGELNTYTPMCGQVCVDQTILQPGYYIAILKTNAGTVTKKSAIVAN